MINTLSMVAGINSLKDKSHLDKTVELIKTEKEWLYQKFNKLDVKYWPSQTNFIFIEPKLELNSFVGEMLAHGIERSIGQTKKEELAVMVDTFKPLMVKEEAIKTDTGNYHTSWLEENNKNCFSCKIQESINKLLSF